MSYMYGRRKRRSLVPRRDATPGGDPAGDGNTGAGKKDGDGDPPAAKKDDGDGEPAGKKDEPTFTNAQVEQIVKERLERERRRQEKAKADEKQELERQRLEAQQEYEQLATNLQTELDELKPELDSLRAQVTERDELIGRYGEVVTSIIAQRTEKLAAPITSLLSNMEPLERLEWLNANSAELGAGAATMTVPNTPKSAAKNGANNEAGDAARKRMGQTARTKF